MSEARRATRRWSRTLSLQRTIAANASNVTGPSSAWMEIRNTKAVEQNEHRYTRRDAVHEGMNRTARDRRHSTLADYLLSVCIYTSLPTRHTGSSIRLAKRT